jgi:hypothetical protein
LIIIQQKLKFTFLSIFLLSERHEAPFEKKEKLRLGLKVTFVHEMLLGLKVTFVHEMLLGLKVTFVHEMLLGLRVTFVHEMLLGHLMYKCYL